MRERIAKILTKFEGTAFYPYSSSVVEALSQGILSLISGIFLLIGLSWAYFLFILAMGLVIYAVINSAGYYGQRKQWPFVIMFGIILIASVSLVILNIIF